MYDFKSVKLSNYKDGNNHKMKTLVDLLHCQRVHCVVKVHQLV